jgi:hypothetical protein
VRDVGFYPRAMVVERALWAGEVALSAAVLQVRAARPDQTLNVRHQRPHPGRPYERLKR